MSAHRLFAALLVLAGCATPTSARAATPTLTLSWATTSNATVSTVVERRTGAADYAILAEVRAGLVEYADTTVTAGVAYCYRVSACGDGTTAIYSTEVCGTYTAPLPPPPPTSFKITLTLKATGPGAGGTVASTPAGILATAPGTYTASFPEFATVILSETPKNNRSAFTGWTGACTGTARGCSIRVIADTPVGAGFSR